LLRAVFMTKAKAICYPTKYTITCYDLLTYRWLLNMELIYKAEGYIDDVFVD